MISKELLSEVWGSKVTSIEKITTMWDMQVLPFWVIEKSRVSGFNDKKYHIAIETVAHKCKEWAYKKEYALTPMNDFGFDNKDTDNFKSYWTSCYINLRPSNGTHLYCVEMTSEPEAIFKACEWIMEHTK